MNDITRRKIVLASQSPRRRDLLQAAGLSFEIRANPVDEEDYPATLTVDEVAEYLAIQKANAVRDTLTREEIAIGADSVVILKDKIYGKPGDHAEAVAILQALSGQMHRVITGVCLLTLDKMVSFSAESKVFFHPLTDEEIDFYITRYQPFDKAGAYAIQEWIGLCKIARIEGTYTNIMGLPVDRVVEELEKF
ncbi:MAG TPA: Maf family nucleotide pyrophosphatase [Flavilitoribacter sp.]|nr:Maf family nucleotide pyrophosphatase [Flavilitoribacter sp.]HMQ86974.1 Maf family nucleotide pyrophosphatase [Flavilitoribacter sp.]